MTTIVWDTHSLSADSRLTFGGAVTREKAKKIVQPVNASVQFGKSPLIAAAAAGGDFYVKPWLAFVLEQSRTMHDLIKFIESGPLPEHAIYSLFVLTDSACFKFTAKRLNYAKSKGIEVNPQFKSKGFLVKRTESENIYLTIDELMTIYHLDLSDCDGQNRVRDLFLIGAFTGLRYSDFSNLKKENFRMVDGVQMSEVKTIKTGEKVVIPLNPIVKAILKKYNGEPPRSISNQKTNAALKKIAQKAEINQAVIRTINEGGINKPVRKKKYELVTTHTARRSFATNAFKAGIPSISIMKITGHKSESSFLKYSKVSKEENAVLMAANPFFKLSPLKIAN